MVVEIRGKAVVMWKIGGVVNDCTQAEHAVAEAWAGNKWEPVSSMVLHESNVDVQDVFTLALCKLENPLRLPCTCGIKTASCTSDPWMGAFASAQPLAFGYLM
jgi:hypothetical protein